MVAAGLVLAATTAAAPEACLLGRVVDPAGAPLAAAAISLVGGGAPGRLLRTATDERGGFELVAVPAGLYVLVAERLGFEPELRPVSVAPSETRNEFILLSPLAARAAGAAGRAELPWLLRAASGDPTRSAAPGLAGPGSPPEAAPRLLAGRVEWNALSGDAGSGQGLRGTGSRAELALAGAAGRSVSWFLDGRLDALAGPDATAGGGAQKLHVGLAVGSDTDGLAFEGEMKRARGAAAARQAAVAERRERFSMSFRNLGPAEEGMDVSLGYRSASAVPGGSTGSAGDDSNHAIVEGQGRFLRRFGRANRLLTHVEFRAQRWSTPNRGFLADAAPQGGALIDGRFLSPRAWDLAASSAFEWRLAPGFRVVPGVDLVRGAGERGVAAVRPRLGAVLDLDSVTRLDAGMSWSSQPTTPSLADEPGLMTAVALGVAIGLEHQLGRGGRVRIEASRNGYRDLQRPLAGPGRMDDLLFARGAVRSHEVRLDLRAPSDGRLVGLASLQVGEARGALGWVPLQWAGAGDDAWLELDDARVAYLSAVLSGNWTRTETGFLVRYRWLDGLAERGDHARIDLELSQGLPGWDPLGAELELVVGVSEYLERPSAGAAPAGAVVFEPAPVLAAGLGLKF